MDKTVEQASRHLGQSSVYKDKYDPSLLVAIGREDNRSKYGILPEESIGFDVWNCYEVSFLKSNGLPVVGQLKITYPSSSNCIVESKSLKLYLNSFNNTVIKDAHFIKRFEEEVQYDLTTLLNTDVKVKLHITEGTKDIYSGFENGFRLESLVEVGGFFHFTKETPEYLKEGIVKTEENHFRNYWTELLRSNCRVTGQPDWGSCFITIVSKYKIPELSLLKYLVSFRNENHFHEEVVEMIYHRLLETYNPTKLLVGAVYTRRGGIDICPIRTNDVTLLDQNLIDATINHKKIFRQ